MDPTQSGAYAGYVQQPQYQAQPQPSIDQAFDRYQNQIRTIFTLARDGSLRDVGGQLLEISHYLLSNAEALGKDSKHRCRYAERMLTPDRTHPRRRNTTR